MRLPSAGASCAAFLVAAGTIAVVAAELSASASHRVKRPMPRAVIGGSLKEWHAVTLTFEGPESSETATPNPFKDYRLDVTFTGPTGRTYRVPGYYAADGNAGESGATAGNKWRVKFCPDARGPWRYEVSFVEGSGIAAELTGGASAGYFDGETGRFTVASTDIPADALDLRGKGKLEYVGEHYLRFRNGLWFLKSGSNIPETFLEYDDFDGTPSNLDYAAHVADWRPGDPTWRGGKGKGIIGALNYLSELGINSMYFITMNNYGDGKKAWPWTGADNYYNYDCSKLDQWDVVFGHMDTLGMMLHVVLTETETESYFEVKERGKAGGIAPSRKIYYREMVARFGYHLAVTWNIGEENGWNDAGGYNTGNTSMQQRNATRYIRSLTYYDDNIGVHNGPSTDDGIYTPLIAHPELTAVELQWSQSASVHDKVAYWRNQSRLYGHRWVVSLDEPWSETTTISQFRAWDVWGAYLAGGAGCEFFQSGDRQFDDFRSKESFYETLGNARRFIESHVPFAIMEPADQLLTGRSGYVLAKSGAFYVVFLQGGSGTPYLDLTGTDGVFSVLWFDPVLGGILQAGSVASVSGGAIVALGAPPSDPGSDWVALVQAGALAPGEAAVSIPMTVAQFDRATGVVTVSFGAACFATDYAIVYGPLSDLSRYSYTGQACGFGNYGTATFDPGSGSSFWIVVGRTAEFEGSYGRSSSGAERPAASSLTACGRPQNLGGGCP